MANNRLYLRCRSCGKMIMIAKHFLTPWHINTDKLDAINDFFDEHFLCFTDNKVYPNSFDLVSEFGEGFPREEDSVLYHYYDISSDTYENELNKQNTEYKYEIAHSEILKNIYEKEGT